jgi:hypothetical protein
VTEEAIRREGVRREDRAHDRQRWVRPLATVFACMFLSVAVNIIYTTLSVNQSNQNWCEIVTSLDDAYQLHPPPATNVAAVTFAGQMHRLRFKLKCK